MANKHSVLLLDLESRPDPTIMQSADWWERKEAGITPDGRLTDPLKIEADVTKKKVALREGMALDPRTAMIVVAGLMVTDEPECVAVTDETINRAGERALLTELAARWPERPCPILGWNVVDFDLPLLIARLAVHGFTLPWLPTPRDYRNVVELRRLFPDGPLDDWSFVMGWGWKAVTGKALLTLSMAELVEHNKADLKVTAAIAARTEFVWGRRE